MCLFRVGFILGVCEFFSHCLGFEDTHTRKVMFFCIIKYLIFDFLAAWVLLRPKVFSKWANSHGFSILKILCGDRAAWLSQCSVLEQLFSFRMVKGSQLLWVFDIINDFQSFLLYLEIYFVKNIFQKKLTCHENKPLLPFNQSSKYYRYIQYLKC